ncbi:MAG TPA: class I tRNA ligase family protein, partial [Solirubrobacteraceae bacterium]|nr:class I tRNA ligase family protein [Solirubrobacteraceae bacterium]
ALLRIAAMNGSPTHPGDLASLPPGPDPRTVEDRWIVSRLQQVKADTAACIESYDFSHAALGLYDFVYSELCDWYLEIVKPRLAAAEDKPDVPLLATLIGILRETVALAHPVIPFVTEELWSYLGGDGLLAGSPWPAADPSLIDMQAEVELERAIEAVTAIRAWRDSVGARPGLFVPARLRADGYDATLDVLARLARVDLAEDGAGPGPVASVAVPCGVLEILSDEGLDLAAAEQRRQAARAKLQAEVARVEGKLADGRFLERAPAAVVAGEREKLARLHDELEAL